jgi:hypothetical protein
MSPCTLFAVTKILLSTKGRREIEGGGEEAGKEREVCHPDSYLLLLPVLFKQPRNTSITQKHVNNALLYSVEGWNTMPHAYTLLYCSPCVDQIIDSYPKSYFP